jgi:uncharacterized coiled-coil protein SlyX
MSELEWQKRVAALERRVAKLEAGIQEIDNVVDPQGWIGEAFTVLERHVDTRLDALNLRMDSFDRKLDTILQHLTGYRPNG